MIRKLPVGIEMYTLREAFAADPEDTLAKIAAFGYDGVEFYGTEANNLPASRGRELMEKYGLISMSYQPNWPCVQPDTIEGTMRFCEEMGIRRIGVAAAPAEMLKTREGVDSAIAVLNGVCDTLTKSGFECGYHAHNTDFFAVDGVTAWQRIFENTPECFQMVVDTGNMRKGGSWTIPWLEKFPNRAHWAHIKPFSEKDRAATLIGDDDFDWHRNLRELVRLGRCDTLVIEYSDNTRYQPMEAAETLVKRLRAYMD